MILIRFIWKLILVTIGAFFLLVFTGSFRELKMQAYNKCDHDCMQIKKYPEVKMHLGFPVFGCECSGYGRMPDDYLRQK